MTPVVARRAAGRPRKRDLPLVEVRRLLEPGPVVLVSSAWRGATNIMTMGWHMMVEFTPSLVACVISDENHSFELIRRSRQCVLNVPTVELVDAVVGIGNTTGGAIDKFARFGLTPVPAAEVDSPLIAECYANLECHLHDGSRIARYGLFIWEVVKAHVATAPRVPATLHYRGRGEFLVPGRTIDKRRAFRRENL